MSNGYASADQLEKHGSPAQRPSSHQRNHTVGGHIDDRSQPALPVVHRTFASPSPLGLLSFATSIFLIAAYGLHARDVQTPNVLIGVLIFFGGVAQFVAGVMEFITGNTFGATVFPSYAAFNFSYAMIYLPGTGIMASYTDKTTGAISSEFNEALAIYVLAWFILSVLFTVAAVRSSWILFTDFLALDICLILLAAGYMTGNSSVMTAAYSFAMIVAFLTYWAGCAGLWNGVTPINLPTFDMYKEE
ncbi:hypothetical protein ASPWEDRAFT_175921 [Aspergillus wentii DTO 134E9]|uniref:GPR1/FUN34/yaaH family protein n=1 Tax=Aspergillus wentii DTO 134E9 TaxID=1073089 RepID=A0A1L9R7B5_ASPWE|nr:uncharacterized protein ASPWEDRAFT_175921 [Aspergillus wentii DTO 134E9]KAI9927441.1 hypothetical protein MW887_003054 [Aspergillus wentii]OJJ30816.1 hypothetical protein ASPWEDRAFT_175921 [Aspergillus wentii DTO 134E9]